MSNQPAENGIFYSEDDTMVVIYHNGIPRDISHLDEAGREQAIAEYRELRAQSPLRSIS